MSPLRGKRVLVTRTRAQSTRVVDLLTERGAEAHVVPAIILHPPADPAAVTRAVSRLADYDVVAFTSTNAVDQVMAEVARLGGDFSLFRGVTVAAVGSGTADALLAHGLAVGIVARDFKGEGLAVAILASKKKRILLPRAKVAREALPEMLRAGGCTVDIVTVYETRPPPAEDVRALRAELEGGKIDAVTFTSGSTVENVCDLLGDDAARLLLPPKIVSIGPVTTDAARRRGVRVDATAEPHTVSGLISALEGVFGGS